MTQALANTAFSNTGAAPFLRWTDHIGGAVCALFVAPPTSLLGLRGAVLLGARAPLFLKV
jgi:hypothetical protein